DKNPPTRRQQDTDRRRVNRELRVLEESEHLVIGIEKETWLITRGKLSGSIALAITMRMRGECWIAREAARAVREGKDDARKHVVRLGELMRWMKDLGTRIRGQRGRNEDPRFLEEKFHEADIDSHVLLVGVAGEDYRVLAEAVRGLLVGMTPEHKRNLR